MASIKMIFLVTILLVLMGAPMLSKASSISGYFGRCYKDSDCNTSSPLRRDCQKRVCMNTYCVCGGGHVK
ncbi:hypothetical protein MIMGU_mgv1a017536mg [Erythranthe guttata]|uniref:Knottin scorpion toxin-like domain-containing protein n=1 Tax=Erythranthe guttata TaxID=4155 RepID=A0A022QMS7_ERYGU|nr:hypothetical protein MIMGU_mgv1a017536mg [Erythranthe guttata]